MPTEYLISQLNENNCNTFEVFVNQYLSAELAESFKMLWPRFSWHTKALSRQGSAAGCISCVLTPFSAQLHKRLAGAKDRPDLCCNLVDAPLRMDEADTFVLDDLIALTRGIYQSGAILNCHMASRICDESCLLQLTGCNADRTAASAQHCRQQLLRYGNLIRWDSVVAHQQPTCQTLGKLM